MTSVSPLKDQIICRYLFDDGFDLGENEGLPGIKELVAECLDALYAINGKSRELSDQEWRVPFGATPFQKVQAAFRSVIGKDASAITRAKRGDLIECYRSLRNEGLKESRLRLWMALPGSKVDYLELKNRSGNEVEELFHAWLKKHPGILKMKELNLTYKHLDCLPPEIGLFTSLEKLDLTKNELEKLPPEIGCLKSLHCLKLGDNKLQELPPEIGRLTSLKFLVLSCNNLEKGLPSEVGRLSFLEYLEINHSKLKELPSEIGKLTQLEALLLRGNQLIELPPEIGELSKLRVLFLEENLGLRELPSKLWNLTELTLLELPDGLEELPFEIGYLTQLKNLVGSQKLFSSLPLELRTTAVKYASIDKNMIDELVRMGQLANPLKAVTAG